MIVSAIAKWASIFPNLDLNFRLSSEAQTRHNALQSLYVQILL